MARWRVVLCCVVMAGAGAGCSKYRFHKSAWMVTRGDAGRYVRTAMEHPNADERRDAIVQLAKTRYADRKTVVEACALIARNDASASVRVAAIRLVAQSRRAEAARELLRAFAADGITAAGERVRVRVACLHGMCFLARNGAMAEEGDRSTAAALGGQVLEKSASRDMKIAAASLLGCVPRVASVRALIGVLNDSDFGVVYEAERSLSVLTGAHHRYDAQAWLAWLASTDDPLAGGGGVSGDAVAAGHWWERVLGMGG